MSDDKEPANAKILGLDIGTNSIGWCLVENKKRIIAAGVRIFEAGTMGTTDQIAAGKDEPRNQKRRQARQARRLLWRRVRRINSVFKRLLEWGLLPSCPADDPAARNTLFNALDKELFQKHVPPSDTRAAHLLPYILRRKALDERLEPDALGRAFYHLAQRRGFLSNRKSAPKDDEDLGMVKASIKSLAEEISAAGARTIGEYFATLDPETARIRQRWTSRQMFLDEFERIWTSQAVHHPAILTPARKKTLKKTMFFQRPLKSQKDLIGRCDLERNSPRAPWPLLEAQAFRILQKVNDLRVRGPEPERPLTPAERRKAMEALQSKGDIKFTELKKLLDLPKSHSFNLQEGDEPKLPGNRTVARIGKVIGAKWTDMTAGEMNSLVHDLMSIQDDEAFVRRMQKRWGLEENTARELARTGFEDGHCALSSKAIRKLLPHMADGAPYMEARRIAYPASTKAAVPLAELPPPPRLRNPIVERALTQLRKVVNSILRLHGKPDAICVELARDLKRPRKLRALASKNNRDIQKGREAAAERLVREAGIPEPKRSDIEKALLWEECSGVCPYTGESISFASLFGPAPQFDVEHIIPYSRSLDDSFLNKTLCHAAENRNVKRNQAPTEAYEGGLERWKEILQRVKSFKGRSGAAKLRRFKMDSEEIREAFESFTNRHLQDTRYASVEASRYLGSLFGCREDQEGVDAAGKRRVQVSAGQITALLRSEWGLNGILGDGGEKTRGDHRHHAVDALVMALAEPGAVAALSAAAAGALAAKRRRFAPLTPPWPTLLEDAKSAVAGIQASHAASKKISGALHEETLYSPPKMNGDGATASHVRKGLGGLSKSDLARIVDPAVRAAVMAKVESLGGDPKKAFADSKNHPHLVAKDGRLIPIHKVRLRTTEGTREIGHGQRRRFVMTGANNHLEVFEAKDKKGAPYWDGRVVSLLDAAGRINRKESVVNKVWEDRKFLFTISGGDTFSMKDMDGKEAYFRARSITTAGPKGREYQQISFSPLNDARTKDAIQAAGAWKRMILDPLRRAGLKKVSLDPLGMIRNSNE